MSIQRLDIYFLRNIKKSYIIPSSGINLIIGENGSGKSSLLEAIFVLGRVKSFRASNIKQVIQFDQVELIVSGQVKQPDGHIYQLGVQHTKKGCEIRVNQESSTKSELAYSLPVLLIHPKSYILLDGGSQNRREFLDWGVFNYKDDFLSYWRKYKKVLLQRNSLLKTKQINQINVWNTELVQYGTIVSKYRRDYLKKLEPFFFQICHYFLNFDTIALTYNSGWNEAESYIKNVENDLQKDLRYGFTHSGPHRCDFVISVNGHIAKNIVSRGELKLLMLSLKLAQVKLINLEIQNSVCLLIDDLTAELDSQNKEKLLKYLSQLDCQVFMSTTELAHFGDLSKLNNYKVFHMEHGEINLLS